MYANARVRNPLLELIKPVILLGERFVDNHTRIIKKKKKKLRKK